MNDQVASSSFSASLESLSIGPASGGQPYLNDLVTAVSAPAMSLSGRDGQIRPGGAEGLYVHDLRVISQLVLSIGGAEPVAVGYDLEGGETNQFHGVVVGTGIPGPDPSVFVLRHRALNDAGMVEQFTVRSYARSAVALHVELALGCDLAGIEAVKSGARPPRRPAKAVEGGLTWELPGRCSVRATGAPAPSAETPDAETIAWDVWVEPGQEVSVSVAVELQEHGPIPPVGAAPRAGPASFTTPEVLAADRRLARLLEVSLADLSCLRMVVPANPTEVFLAAGAPWYLTLFGRDSIWAARMLLPLGTDLALGTLRALAGLQGRRSNPDSGEQPGRIIHEVRREAMAGQQLPSLPPLYYGTVDATPLWVCLLHDAWRWGLADTDVEPLLAPMQRCLTWMAELGCSRDGFVSYIDESGHGLANQGWKDSGDAVQFRDGHLGRAPLALCEVQGYAYEAAIDGADLLDAFGLEGGDRWRDFASDLAKRFHEQFWVDDADGPYPAMALEDGGAPVDSLSSNIGHLLGTGLLDAAEAELVARRLHGSDLNCGFGLRTLAASSRGFNPVSYHCGSVWAHDTAIAIAGLARTPGPAAAGAATSLIEGLLSAAEGFDYRLPELYAGYQRSTRRAPLPYPASCHPQAWAAASSVVILTALLGMRPDMPHRTVHLAPIATPVGLHRVVGLRLGGAPVSVEVGPDGHGTLTAAPPGLRVTN